MAKKKKEEVIEQPKEPTALEKELSGFDSVKKAALLMRVLGEQQAAEIIALLNRDEVEKLGTAMVDVGDVTQDAVDREPEKVYQPGHPKADEDGYIFMAAVNTEEELVEMLEASRQYENNVEVVSTLRGLMMRTISMGK